ncbi:MAG: PTS sugar transporter subunit IIA [Candidatus Omnitrophica bacterium]|nr:PTS sugar transporter subunit IIA [Candidatus Omnitrophota bacterium]
MFDILSYLYEDLITVNLKAENKNDAIKELIDTIYQKNPLATGSVSKEDAIKAVMKRESSESTGIGEGLGFPHARIKGWNNCVVAIAGNLKGIDFNSMDGEKVHFIALIISPDETPYLILQVMAALIRGIRNNKKLCSFGSGLTVKEIYDELRMQHSAKVVLAQDIMRSAKFFLKMNDSVESAVRLMHLNQVDTLPVVDENHQYKGAVSCFDIFNYGIPDFFNQLQTVSFVRHLDPFEKYFIMKNGLTVKNILRDSNLVISQDDTLMEIIFQLSVKNKAKLFVVKDGRLVGEIDRFSLIDKVLFF